MEWLLLTVTSQQAEFRKRGGRAHSHSHFCFGYSGQESGTNQEAAKTALKNTDWSDAQWSRYKGWNKKNRIGDLASDIENSGCLYAM